MSGSCKSKPSKTGNLNLWLLHSRTQSLWVLCVIACIYPCWVLHTSWEMAVQHMCQDLWKLIFDPTSTTFVCEESLKSWSNTILWTYFPTPKTALLECLANASSMAEAFSQFCQGQEPEEKNRNLRHHKQCCQVHLGHLICCDKLTYKSSWGGPHITITWQWWCSIMLWVGCRKQLQNIPVCRLCDFVLAVCTVWLVRCSMH